MAEFPQLLQAVLDTTDVRGLAEFYRELLGWDYRDGDAPTDGPDDADWLVVVDPQGSARLAFQYAETVHRTTWPSPDVPMQLHLDLTVGSSEELERQRVRVERLGGRLLQDRRDEDPEEPLYVFADPAGHPFCVFVG